MKKTITVVFMDNWHEIVMARINYTSERKERIGRLLSSLNKKYSGMGYFTSIERTEI